MPRPVANQDSRKSPWYSRISIRVLFWFFLAALVPLLIAGGISIIVSRQALLDATLRDPRVESLVFGQEVRDLNENLRQVAGNILESESMVNYAAGVVSVEDEVLSDATTAPVGETEPLEAADALAHEFEKIANKIYVEKEYAVVTRLSFVDSAGQELVGVSVDSEGETKRIPAKDLRKLQKLEVFQSALVARPGEHVITTIEYNPVAEVELASDPQNSIIRLAAPVDHLDGTRSGVLVVNADPEFLLETLYPDNNNFTAVDIENIEELKILTDANGYFLLYPDLTKRWGGPDELSTGADFQKEFPVINKSIFGPKLNSYITDEFKAIQTRADVDYGDFVDTGETILSDKFAVHYRPIFPDPENPALYWMAIYILPGQLVTDPIFNLEKILGALMVVLVGIVMLMSWIATRLISGPILALRKGVEVVERGDLKHQIAVKGQDEISQLGRAFNQMTARLKASYSNLEAKVQNRTQELRKFQQAVDSSTDGIIIMTAGREIVYVNPAWEKQTGYRFTDIRGRGPETIFSSATPKATTEKLLQQIERGQEYFSEDVIIGRKSGRKFQAQFSVVPIREGRQTLFFVIIQQDITLRKDIDRAKTEFVSLASHQLRTPLSSINWYTEMLLNGDAGKITKKQKEFLDEIYFGNKRMVELVGDLLNVSRLELGTFMVESAPTVVPDVIHQTLFDVASMVKDKKITVTEKYTQQQRIMQLDAKLLSIISTNLISNAVKYTAAGGLVTISTEVVRTGKKFLEQTIPFDGLIFTVTDSGFGIPSDQQDHIFSKLFRADNVRERVTKGTGLGLYMVKQILDEVGGKIWFKSVENRGTTFAVLIPLAGMQSRKGSKPLT